MPILQWHKLEKTNRAIGTVVSYCSVSRWDDLGEIVDRPAKSGYIFVHWLRSNIVSEELIINLLAWNKEPTEFDDTYHPKE